MLFVFSVAKRALVIFFDAGISISGHHDFVRYKIPVVNVLARMIEQILEKRLVYPRIVLEIVVGKLQTQEGRRIRWKSYLELHVFRLAVRACHDSAVWADRQRGRRNRVVRQNACNFDFLPQAGKSVIVVLDVPGVVRPDCYFRHVPDRDIGVRITGYFVRLDFLVNLLLEVFSEHAPVVVEQIVPVDREQVEHVVQLDRHVLEVVEHVVGHAVVGDDGLESLYLAEIYVRDVVKVVLDVVVDDVEYRLLTVLDVEDMVEILPKIAFGSLCKSLEDPVIEIPVADGVQKIPAEREIIGFRLNLEVFVI